MSAPLLEVADQLVADGGLLAAALAPREAIAAAEQDLGARIAAGPHPHAADLAVVLEAAREGALLHTGRSRVLATEDRDLQLLAGDRLYALGLARLADRGDLDSVAVLADTIALSARAQATADENLAHAVWQAAAAALGFPGDPAVLQAFVAARAGAPDAAEALGVAARHVLQPGA